MGKLKGFIEIDRQKQASRDVAERVRDWQDRSAAAARRRGLDVVRVQSGREHGALAEFLDSRRRRKR